MGHMPVQALLPVLLKIMNLSKHGLSNNFLKIIAIISMTIDHIGLILLDDYPPFRIIGRLAFPIFAYFISEGCFFTKNKKRYFMQVFIVGIISQIIYTITTGDWYLNILLTFSFSILLIYATDKIRKENKSFNYFYILLLFLFLLMSILEKFGVYFDYGFIGIVTPLIIYIASSKKQKIIYEALMLILLSLNLQGNIQFFSLLALPILWLYNGKRGRYNLKIFFYLFYPLHLGIIYLLSLCA